MLVVPLQITEVTKASAGFILLVDHDTNEMFCQVNNLYTVECIRSDHAK